MTLEQRKAALEAMSWREIKNIAEGLGIEKPDGGSWEDTIPNILEQEFPANPEPPVVQFSETNVSEVVTVEGQQVQVLKPNPVSVAAPESSGNSEPIYGTEFYKSAGIPTCGECGDKRRSGAGGQLICPHESDTCPVLGGS